MGHLPVANLPANSKLNLSLHLRRDGFIPSDAIGAVVRAPLCSQPRELGKKEQAVTRQMGAPSTCSHWVLLFLDCLLWPCPDVSPPMSSRRRRAPWRA